MLGLRGSDQQMKRKEKNAAKGGRWAALISRIIEPTITDSTGNNEQYSSTFESHLCEYDQLDHVLHQPQNDRNVQLALVRKRVFVRSISFTELDHCN